MSTRNLKRWMKRQKQKGFTLLELLVVVAILAAVAGTATIALQDTDSRAAAAAHVAMMDELNKGIRTYRVLNRIEGEVFPNHWDSLIQVTSAPTAGTALDTPTIANVDSYIAIEDVVALDLDNGHGIIDRLEEVTITDLQYIINDSSANPDGDEDCSDVQALINSRGNAVVAGNIFLTPAANGCGISRTLVDGAAGATIAVWTGGQERLTGQPAPTGAYNIDGNKVFMTVGAGPASTLFEGGKLGALTSVPVYRHVAKDQYNRFIVIFEVGEYLAAATNGVEPVDQVALVAIVDGAGDTKEEELGEWDGTRNTI